MFGDWRIHNQERRAWARRGVLNRPRAVRIERCSATCETTTKTGVVSPPSLGKRTCQHASAKSRESVNAAITNPGAIAVANPRGADAPRSWWSCGTDICRRKCDLCNTRTLLYKSGEPPARRGSVT
jgi:hypothetical protein